MKFIEKFFEGIDKTWRAFKEFFGTLFVFIGFPITTYASFYSAGEFMNDGEKLKGIGLYIFAVIIALITIGAIYVTISEWIEKVKKRNKKSS
ncbi:hypothetical protein [Neobacillus kokaensis]|uniref:Uncharacterized protein n=1 Tax=Neobacillus kokaensis TaxID=2759023 RepID=A0ABQ3N7K9_9BACI|nr:hypothetical protein [Neobacillus kokaensis]GHH99840.1 hypothetical protein AM1BK_33830 [Neobacillus kokaensis]